MARIIAMLAFLVTATNITAQSTGTIRKGLLFSFANGIAHSQLRFSGEQQHHTDLAMNWKIGYLLHPRLALLLNGSVSIYQYNLSGRPRKRDFGGIFPSVQFHATERFWILGGAGLGTDAPVFYDLKTTNEVETKYYTGTGIISAAGYEIYQRKNFVIDIQARLTYSRVNLPIGKTQGFNTALLLGINFY